MNKLILILIPIAASNIFGLARYLLIQLGVVADIDRVWRIAPLVLAIFLSAMLAKTKSFNLGCVSIVILAIGAISSLAGIWLGLKVGSNIAVGLGIFWLLAFSIGAYKLPSKYMMAQNA